MDSTVLIVQVETSHRLVRWILPRQKLPIVSHIFCLMLNTSSFLSKLKKQNPESIWDHWIHKKKHFYCVQIGQLYSHQAISYSKDRILCSRKRLIPRNSSYPANPFRCRKMYGMSP